MVFIFATYRSVAQLGRALRSGRRGRRFKSCRFDSWKTVIPVKGVTVFFAVLLCLFCFFALTFSMIVLDKIS